MRAVYTKIDWYVRLCVSTVLQYFTPLFTESYLIFWRIAVIRPKDFVIPHGGVLFISNHQSKADPFLISCSVGFTNFFVRFTLNRYPVISEYMVRPVMGRMIGAIGGYDIGETPMERMKKLLYTRQILTRYKQRLLIFPEGKINRTLDLTHDEFQDGIKMLFKDSVPVIFVRLTGLNTLSLKNFFGKEERSIRYSEVLTHATSEEKIETMKRFYA